MAWSGGNMPAASKVSSEKPGRSGSAMVRLTASACSGAAPRYSGRTVDHVHGSAPGMVARLRQIRLTTLVPSTFRMSAKIAAISPAASSSRTDGTLSCTFMIFAQSRKSAATVPSPDSSITTLSPALSHTVFTRLPVSTICPACNPLPSAAR